MVDFLWDLIHSRMALLIPPVPGMKYKCDIKGVEDQLHDNKLLNNAA